MIEDDFLPKIYPYCNNHNRSACPEFDNIIAEQPNWVQGIDLGKPVTIATCQMTEFIDISNKYCKPCNNFSKKGFV
jgi:hypothetical protein